MENWIPKNRIIKFVITLAIFSMLLYFVSLAFLFYQTKQKTEYFNSNESASSKDERFWIIKSITETNKEPIQNLNNFFIKKGDEVSFIEQIEDAARHYGVDFEIDSIDVKTDEKNTNSFKEDVSVKIKVEGSWKNINGFFDNLEKMPFGVSIEEVGLDADTPGVWSGFVDLTIFREK